MENKDASTTTNESRPRNIVCVYSQADESFCLQLTKSLNLWERQGHVRWLKLLPGDELSVTLRNYVKHADLILLLLSPDFFPDELCYQTMHLALQERASRQVPVVPILVRVVNWRQSACKDIAVVPHNEQPVASWTLPDEAYASIGVELARLVPGLSPIRLPTRPRLFQAPDQPKGYVPRPKAFEEIKRLLLNHQGNQTTAITTALRGAGGFGKTTLALALCHDPEIQATFPDGILWVELGERPPGVLNELNGLLATIEKSHTKAVTLEEAKKRWRAALYDQVCLLVIDDVWQTEALLPLLEGGPQCARLVTTRNDLLLPKDVARVLVDAMEPREALTLLCQDLPEEISQATYQPKLEALVAQLGYWPLLLTLARGMLTDLVTYGLSISEALTTVADAYQTRGVAAFRLDSADERQQTVDVCLRVSLQYLEEKFTHPRYRATERYQELAVFPEDTGIPLATLQIYWKGSAGLDPWETKDLCIRLHRLSLLLSCNLGTGTVRLHDVLRSYLIQHAGSHLPNLHASLLDTYQQVLGLTRWADLPRSEAYLWQHLILHLCQAGYQEVLQTTLTDLSYLTRKALYVGVSSLESDLLFVSTVPSTNTEVSFFASLHRYVVGISHLLRQTKTEAEMGGLLLSHLAWEATFAAQRLSLEHNLPRPFLTAWHPLPNRLSSALLRTLHGQASLILGCAVSPDGSFIVSASWDLTLKVWDAATGVERLTLIGHTNRINGCAVSPDSSFIVSASWDQTLKVWDAATGAERLTLIGHSGEVRCCAVSPDGSFIVSASDDKTLKMWDAATGAERLTLTGHTSRVSCCAVSPDGSFIVSASWDQTLKVWDAATGAERLTLIGHTYSVTGCAVSPDGAFIVSASDDKTLKMWDAATGAERLTLTGHTNRVNCCAVSPDGNFIVSAAEDETLKVWDTATGAERLTLSDYTGGIDCCAVSPDGSFIVSASSDETLKVWDVATEAAHLTLSDQSSVVYGCAVSPNGSIIVSASGDKTLKIWDVATGAERLTLIGHSGEVLGCAVSPDGSFIVSASWDQTLKVWDAATGTERLTLTGHTNRVNCCAVSPDGAFIVSASNDKTLKMWDVATGVERLTLSGHSGEVLGCAVSPDGKFIISASNDETLKVWDVATGVERLTLIGHWGEVRGYAVSPNSSFIVSAAEDETLKVWDAVTGAERLTLSGHSGEVLGCAVSPDGSFIISASLDKTLKVWNAQTGQCLLTFPVDKALSGCAFHPDGEHLVACGMQGMFFLRLVV